MSELPAAERRLTMSCGNQRGPAGTIQQIVDGQVRRIDFEPGYDCIQVHGKEAGMRCHGRHGMNLRFLLIGDEGAVQFLVYALDWLPDSTVFGSTRDDLHKFGIMAADLGHHWRRPVYEDEEPRPTCEYLDGAACFYDGSSTNAAPVLDAFLCVGLDAVWENLTDYYAECSRVAKNPGGSP